MYVPMTEIYFQNPLPPESDRIEYAWVSICAPDGINRAATDVACRQLGYERVYDYGGAISFG